MTFSPRYLLSRLGQGVVTILVITTVVFFLFRLAPGDPSAYLVDSTFPPEVQESLRQRFGLESSLAEQYGRFVLNSVRGDLGVSFFYGRPVNTIILERLLNTLVLALAAFVVAYGLAITVGSKAAQQAGSWLDNLATSTALIFRSAPLFWVGMLALMLFSFNLGWLPHAGMRSVGYDASGILSKFLSLDFLRHLVLPAVVSGLYFWGLPFLLVRSSTIEILKEDFIELARAKGLSERRILYRHGVRNALLPLATAAAAYIGTAAGGIVVIEVVFSWPGLGREIVTAVQRHDYALAQGAFLLLATMVVVMNLVVDLVYGALDPRVRVGSGQGE